ncbi:MAG: CAP domain-containing protein [Candidatus Staskawiczbacteria bacterium]|nr:CAP domain-containing protein [Candidatus Staskawiczbacteria bacterium]
MDYTLEEELVEKIISHSRLLFVPFEKNNFRPKFLRNNVLFYVVICLLIIRIVSTIIFINFPKNIFFADITKTVLMNLINKERSSLGISPLIENQKLDQAAELKAKDILEKDYFSHQSPDGITPWYWFLKTGYNYKYAGENLAIGFLNSEDVFRAWIGSASHKENIINPNYKEIGTAVLTGDYKGNNTTVIVQLFGNPKVMNTPLIEKVIEDIQKVDNQPIDKNVEQTNTEPQTTKEDNLTTQSKVLAQFTEAPQQENNVLYYKLLNFLFYNSNIIFEYIIYFLLILTSIALLINIIINFNIQDSHLIFRSLLIIALLFTTLLVNKEIVNQFIHYKVII